MEINKKKLKRNAEIGDKIDMVPLIVNVISLFGIGIFTGSWQHIFFPQSLADAL